MFLWFVKIIINILRVIMFVMIDVDYVNKQYQQVQRKFWSFVWLWKTRAQSLSACHFFRLQNITISFKYVNYYAECLFISVGSEPTFWQAKPSFLIRRAEPSFLLSNPSQTQLSVFQNWAIFDYFQLTFLKNTTF